MKPYVDPDSDRCPYVGIEHNPHWYPSPNFRNSQTHCIGWHALHRDISRTKAKFHAKYLRGRNSNLIHRSTGEGEIIWFPPFHTYGPARVTYWSVQTVCPKAPLKNPTLLTAREVECAQPYETKTRYKTITLCTQCFPGGSAEWLKEPRDD